MGRIFSWDEVRDGKVPRPEDFEPASKLVVDALRAVDSCVVAGMFCGSVTTKPSSRSDIDLVIIYNLKGDFVALRQFGEIAGRVLAKWHIPVQFIALNDVVAQTSMHHFQPSFVRHLKWLARNGATIIKKNPVPMLGASCFSDRDDSRIYIQRKLRELEEGATRVGDGDLGVLKNALECPVWVAMKVLALSNSRIIHESKRKIVLTYCDRFGGAVGKLLAEIYDADSGYTYELEAQGEALDASSYDDELQTLRSTVFWKSLEFVRLNALMLTQRLP